MVDAWMLERFPGKTLEELDDIDWHRHLRAWEAGNMQALEAKRNAMLAGDINKDAITVDEWERIKDHDGLYER